MTRGWTFFAAATLAAASLATPVLSAEERFAGDVVQIVPDGKVHNTTLSVAGPGGYYAQAFAKAGITEDRACLSDERSQHAGAPDERALRGP